MRRNGNIEFLRCLLMFLIVFGHSCLFGVLPWKECYWLVVIVLGIRWHVDAFVTISGWYGIRFRWSKVLKLIGVFVFYSVLSWCFGGSVGFVSGGWFGSTYLMLMFMSPLLNAGIERLSAESPRTALLAWIAFAAGMILNWMPHHAFTGCAPSGGGSHTLLTMIFVYVTARLVSLSKRDVLDLRLLRYAIPISLIVIILGGGVSLLNYLHGIPPTWDNVKWITDYDSPATWLTALVLVAFFVRKVRLPAWLDRTTAFLAPSMFGVYLLHSTTVFGLDLFRVPQAWMRSHCDLPIVVNILASSVVTFCAGVAVDLLRRAVVFAVRKPVESVFGKIHQFLTLVSAIRANCFARRR